MSEENPIGYIQTYIVEEEGKTFGMDQFIGETEYWNKGKGKNFLLIGGYFSSNISYLALSF